MSRSSFREISVGLTVLIGVSGLGALFVLSTSGPGFLGPRRTIEVVFKDGQGVRAGCPVRIAGVDAGRVVGVGLFEADDGLRVKLKLSLPTDLADHLKQDARIVISSGLTGQSTLNIVSSGKSSVALVPGQVLQGIESSLFDPVMEQVGLGPSERNHLQHMIAQIRATIDEVAPRLRESMTALSDTSAEIRATVADIRPRVQAVASEIEQFAKDFDDASVAQTLAKVQHLATQADAVLAEMRPVLTTLVQNLDGLTSEVRTLAASNRPEVEKLIKGLNATREKLDVVLANSQIITGQTATMLVQNRADIERTLSNVRDATGYGVKLVQKLYGNPFYLSPFYKPKPEDIRAQEMFEYAHAFLAGAEEFHDAMKTLQAMREKAKTPSERDAYNDLYKRAWNLSTQLSSMQTQFAQQLQINTPVRR